MPVDISCSVDNYGRPTLFKGKEEVDLEKRKHLEEKLGRKERGETAT